MTAPIITPHMQMLLPTIGVTNPYPQYIIDAFAKVNIHDHDPNGNGIGKQLDEKSVAWSTFDGEAHSIYDIGGLNFNPISFIPAENLSLYFVTDAFGSDLFFKNGAGLPIRITIQGHVNNVFSVTGFYGDFKTYNASVVYEFNAKTYNFSSAVGPSTLNSFKFDFSGVTSLVTVTDFTITLTSVDFTVASHRFFNTSSIVAFSNFFLQDEVFLNFSTAISPRLISTVAQLKNQNANFPIRYQLPQNTNDSLPITMNRTTGGLIAITFTSGSFYRPGGNSAFVYNSCQDGYPIGKNISSRTLDNGLGSIFGATPQYNADIDPTAGFTVDSLNFTISIDTSVINANFTPRIPQLAIITFGSTVSAQVRYFDEGFLNYIQPSPSKYIIIANYRLVVFDKNTGKKTNDYKVIVRI